MCINAKEKDKKERKGRRVKKELFKAQRVKYPIPSQATCMLIGVKSRMENNRKKGNRDRASNPAAFSCLLHHPVIIQ